eukprot:TRINITY_DN1671_c0_g1_i5.p1 TRINITY_DN1671_c0_g1~~TRINITY_DN1671_c0_g1_i5.p1  ORF type:complete len:261 (+),score=28.10 TRINITY_DN1671_c0_g1_i5:303-1085(+)
MLRKFLNCFDFILISGNHTYKDNLEVQPSFGTCCLLQSFAALRKTPPSDRIRIRRNLGRNMLQLSSSCLTKFQIGNKSSLIGKRWRAQPQPTKMSQEGIEKQILKGPEEKPVPVETVTPAPAYNIPIACALISGVGAYEGIDAVGWIFGILGVFLAIQASRVKFIFGPQALEVAIGKSEKELQKTENVFVGGENIWRYDSFTNWEFWWPNFPVLVYFKESQTKPEGQIHFFPVIFNGKQVYDVMVERCGSSQNSAPKQQL